MKRGRFVTTTTNGQRYHAVRAPLSPQAVLAIAQIVPTTVLYRSLSADERCVLSLVDGYHSLGEILSVAGLGRKRGMQAITALVRAGILEQRPTNGKHEGRTHRPAASRIEQTATAHAANSNHVNKNAVGNIMSDRQPTPAHNNASNGQAPDMALAGGAPLAGAPAQPTHPLQNSASGLVEPAAALDAHTQPHVTLLGYDDYKGPLVIGKLNRGALRRGQHVVRIMADSSSRPLQVLQIVTQQGVERGTGEVAQVDDIVTLTDGAGAGEPSAAPPDGSQPLLITVEQPRAAAEQTPAMPPTQAPHPASEPPRSSLRSTLATFAPFVRPYWLRFSIAVLAVIGTSFVGLLKPWPLKFLIDNVLHIGPGMAQPANLGQTIALISGAIVTIAFVLGLLSYIKQYVLAATSQRVAFRLRSVLFAHLQRLPLAFHDRQRTGDLMTRVTNDVTKVQELVTDDLLLGGVTSLVQLVGMLTVMLVVDWKLGLIASASAPLIVLTTQYYRRMIRAQEQQVRAKEGDIASLTQEAISSIRVVKAFGRGSFETQRFEEQTGAMLDAGIKASRIEALFGWSLNLVNSLVLASVVAFGAYQVLAGALSAGTLIVFIQYMRDLQSPLLSLSKLSTKVAKATVRADRLLEILNEHPSVDEQPDATPAPPLRGGVRFEHVSFSYTPDGRVLHNIDFEVRPGERIALVGQTGAGKTTLAALLLRLYAPSNGRILLDGHDVRQFTHDSVIAQIGIVLQDALLFRTTIRENIAYGQPNASFDEIVRAAEIADCLEFIERLPDKFETVVGERGGTLSGGQRQRIAIARAVIRNTPILILDEPTTGLDAASEQSVGRALDRLTQNKTTFVISHNLDLIRTADRIFLLADGRIAEAGTHEQLLALGGRYAELYRTYRSDRLLVATNVTPHAKQPFASNGHAVEWSGTSAAPS